MYIYILYIYGSDSSAKIKLILLCPHLLCSYDPPQTELQLADPKAAYWGVLQQTVPKHIPLFGHSFPTVDCSLDGINVRQSTVDVRVGHEYWICGGPAHDWTSVSQARL